MAQHTAHKGFSLIEMAVILMFVSIAVAPIVTMIGGPMSNSGQGNITRLNGLKAKEVIAANSILERALAMDPTVTPTLGPASGTVNSLLGYGYQKDIQYDWRMAAVPGNQLPAGSHLTKATLRVTDMTTNRRLLLPTFIFNNDYQPQDDDNITSFLLVLDRSGSMNTCVGGSSVSATPTLPAYGTVACDGTSSPTYGGTDTWGLAWKYSNGHPSGSGGGQPNRSRFQFIRDALIHEVLMPLSSETDLKKNIQIGIAGYAGDYAFHVPYEIGTSNYSNVRNYIIASSTSPGNPGVNAMSGNTSTYDALRLGLTEIKAPAPKVTKRIMLLVTDGEPCCNANNVKAFGDTTGHNGYINYKDPLTATPAYPAAELARYNRIRSNYAAEAIRANSGNKVALYTLGVAFSAPNLLGTNVADVAEIGGYATANNATQLRDSFKRIKYELVKAAMANKNNRYGLNYDTN